MKIKKTLSVFMALVILFGSLSMVSVQSFAWPTAGSESYSTSAMGGYGKCGVSMTLSGASAVSGSKVTYYVDRYDVGNFSDMGNIYSVDFAMDGCVLTTSVSTTEYDISEKFINNSTWFSTGDNVQLSNTASGYLIGTVPAVGTVKEFSITARISVDFKYGKYALTDSCSVSATIRIEVVDSSALRAKIGTGSILQESCWTASSYENYTSVLSDAQALIANGNVAQSSMDTMVSRLDSAKNALVHDGPITECEYCRSYKRGGNVTAPIAYRDYVYGADTTRQSMDLFLPSNVSGDTSLILYLHGGGWIYGDKSGYTGKAYEDCMKYGVATLAINYRYASPSVTGHDIMNDALTAVTKAKEIAAQHGMNLTKMMTTGGSAGGHLALLYAYSMKNVSPVTPVCVISKCGPTNLTNHEYLDSNLGENTILFELGSMCGKYFTASTMDSAYNELLSVSPINYVNANTVPTVICHGMKDITVPFSDAQTLDRLLTYYGVSHHFLAYPNTNHALDNLDKELDPYYYWYSWELYDQYINTYLLDEQPSQVHNYQTTTVAPTCTSDGYTMYDCTICGAYYVGDVIYAAHTAGSNVRESYTAPTCTTAGGYDDVVYCTVCGETVSRTHVQLNSLGHAAGEWEVVTPANYSNDGSKVKRCTVCGAVVENGVIPKLVASFSLKGSAPISIDSGNALLKNVPQGTDNMAQFFDMSGCTVETSNSIAGTGTAVTLKNLDGGVMATYTAVVGGDVTGDGYVDTFDLALAGEYINTFTEPEDIAFMKSADLFEDGYLDSTDLAYLIYIANFE